MAPKYRAISPDVWDKRFSKLSPEAKLIAFYIWTAPVGNSEGLSRIPFHYIVGDVGFDDARVALAMVELEKYEYIKWDEDNEVILDRLALRVSPLRNGKDKETGEVRPDNRISGAIRKLEGLPPTPLLRELARLAQRESPDFYAAMLERFPLLVGEAPSEGHQTPIAPPTKARVEKSRVEKSRARQSEAESENLPIKPTCQCGSSENLQMTRSGRSLCSACLKVEQSWDVPYLKEASP